MSKVNTQQDKAKGTPDRMSFVDYVESLSRDNQISETLANRVTL